VAAALVLALFAAMGVHEGVIRGYAGLALGAGAALAVNDGPLWRERLARWPAAPVGLAAMAMPYAGAVLAPHPYAWNLLVAVCAVPLVAGLWFRERGALARVLGGRAIAWVGRLTYAMYLLHVLVINVLVLAAGRLGLPFTGAVAFIVSYGASIAVAVAAHGMVEKPLIEVGRRLARRAALRRGATAG
jgi:peptidoglycan/LPS O-acetylase OafA/YrhL